MRLVRTLLAALAVVVTVSACGSDITAPNARAAKSGKVEAIRSGSAPTIITEPIEESQTQGLLGGSVDASGLIPDGCIRTEVVVLGIVQTVILCEGRQSGSGG